MSGVDSAIGPTPAQAQAIKAAGHLWHGWYCGGPAAFHNWTRSELDVLRGEYELSLPIYVPDLGEHARDAAERALFIVGLAGWRPVVAWDTEAYMRRDPRLVPFLVDACNVVAGAGGENVVYAGGFATVNDWPRALAGLAYPWWIIPGGRQAPPGTAWQVGQDTIGGLHVDVDSIGSGFPLATQAA